MSSMEATLKTEGYLRARFLQPMREWIEGKGATGFQVNPEGPTKEQYERGDFEYDHGGRRWTADMKGDREMYGRLNLFFETLSNKSNPNRLRENPGWGTKKAYDRVWYCFHPIGWVALTNLHAWADLVKEQMDAGDRSLVEKPQSRNPQENETWGVPCSLPWMLTQDRRRAEEGKERALLRMLWLNPETGSIQSYRPEVGVEMALKDRDDASTHLPWPDRVGSQRRG